MLRELPEPFNDWTIDDNGTIYTASGYRCTPQILEAALWLFEFGKRTFGSKLMFSADDAKPRPLYSISDIHDAPAEIKRPTRRRPNHHQQTSPKR